MEAYLMNQIKQKKANGFIKRGTFTNEIIFGGKSYVFSVMEKNKQDSFKKGMFLFGMVRKDAKEYLKHKNIKLPKRYNQVEYNQDIELDDDIKITGTDLNHAYWRIALNLGIISEITYYKGLANDLKSVRLAALSTLGADKKYNVIKDGVVCSEVSILKGDEQLQSIYKFIRYTCYKYMNEVKKLLGNDFICYKTDAIYYIDNKDNRKKVADFFERKNLLVKQLD
jgi:hypothetical protein